MARSHREREHDIRRMLLLLLQIIRDILTLG